MNLRSLTLSSLLSLLMGAICLADQPSRSTPQNPTPQNSAPRSSSINPYRPSPAPARATLASPPATPPQAARSPSPVAPGAEARPPAETPTLDRVLAETGRLPIVARGDLREEIKSLDINDRPRRPLHFYGNTVRRRSGAATTTE